MSTRVLTIFALVAFIIARSSAAGERLTVAQLVERASVIASVDVSLTDGKVKLKQVMLGDAKVLAPPEQWIGFCLPDRALLRRWQQTHAHLDSAPLWQKALDAGRYSAVVFFSGDPEAGLRPTCETEGMLAQSWSVNPDRPAFVNALLTAMKTQARKNAARGRGDSGAPKQAPAPAPSHKADANQSPPVPAASSGCLW